MRPFRRTTLLAATAIFLQAVAPAAAYDMARDAAAVRIEYLPLSGPPLRLYQNAKKALAAGNPQKAITDLNEAIRQRPDSGELRTALVEALQAAGRNDEAQRIARAAANDMRIDAATRRWLAAKSVSGSIAEKDGKGAETRKASKPLIATKTNSNGEEAPAAQAKDEGLDDDALSRLSALADRIRRERADEAAAEGAAKPTVAARTDSETAEVPAGKAEDAALDDDAIRRLSELAARIRQEGAEKADSDESAEEPRKPETAPLTTDDPAYKAADAAYSAYERGDYEKAVADAEEAVRKAPDNGDYQKLLDNARAALVQASGKDTARQIGQATPNDTELDDETRRLLSERAAAIRQEQAGESEAKDLPETVPATNNPAYKAADAAYRAYERGAYRQAVADAEEAVRLAPSNSDYQALLKNAEKALAQTNAKPAVSSPAATAAQEAYTALRRNDDEAALRYARQAARNAPDNQTYQVLLIDVLNRNDMLEDALRVADAAIARFGPDRTLLGQRGVIRQQLGDQAGARADFEQALAMPGPGDDAQLRLNLAAAAMATEAPELAYQALLPLGDSDDAEVWLARTKALTAMEAYTAAATALAQAEAKAATDRQKADITVAGLDLLMARDGGRSARSALRGAKAEGLLAPLGATETAYLAARLGDRPLAYDAFSEAYAAGAVEGRQLIDAAYAARRDYHNDDAVSWLKRAIDEADAGELALSPEELFALRRQVSDISRRWGANIGLYYGSSGISDAYITPSAAAGQSMQLGSEFFWRPPVIGYRDGRTVDFFIRQFTTVYDSLGGAVGAPTTQGAAGVRVKPFTNLNLTLEAARYFKIGRYSRDDYLLRAAISDGFNTDLMPGSSAWWTGRYYGEAGRYLESNEAFALGNASLGRSFRFGDDGNFIITPFIGISADYNNTYATEFALGAGPGLNLRYWFRETKYEAPMSYIDINGQYRARLGGDDRAQGWFASLNLMI